MINLHFRSAGNVGDEYCAPAHYYPIAGRYHLNTPDPRGDVIYGGGCIAVQAIRLALGRTEPSIAWGIGTTVPLGWDRPVMDYRVFELAGTRDWPPDPGAEYVPCPSCMSPLFDDPPDPTQEVVEYGHAQQSPMAVNNDLMDMAAVIKHLCKGETVITSSYHGMVWATWLGRKVITKPFWGKFLWFPGTPLDEARGLNDQFWDTICQRFGPA